MKNFKEMIYGNLLEGKRKKEKFPDLTGDGKVTFADILKGRGVKLKKEERSEASDAKPAEKIKREQYVQETVGVINFISAEELEKLLADTAMSDKKVVPDLSYEIKSFTEGEQDGTKVLGLKMVGDVVYFKTNEKEDGPDQGVYYKISV